MLVDADHCTNANEENFSAKLLTNYVQLRNELIKHLVSLGSMSNPKEKKAVPVTFVWRGFRSVRGSLRTKPTSGSSTRGSFRGWNSGGRSGRSGFGYKRGFSPLQEVLMSANQKLSAENAAKSYVRLSSLFTLYVK